MEKTKKLEPLLIDAKENWENFRVKYCRAVSTMYGGNWTSVHERECLINLAESFTKFNEKYNF